ncbi:MAG TPA: CDP-alcohol phosphatidyltransferase family protein [Steroidobacteraceae bacterium]|jgi:cardiolipin synthase
MRHIPNALCVLRMLLVVPVSWLLIEENYRLTLGVFAFAAATDGLDGFLAKRFGWTSELGKILDPLADKLLLVSVFLVLAIMGHVPWWLALTAIARDLTITIGAIVYRVLYGPLHGRPTTVSKLNTLCQIVYLLVVVASGALGRAPEVALDVLGALVFVTTVVSGIDYVMTYTAKAVRASRERRGRAG